MKAKDWTETAAGWTQEIVGNAPYDVGPYGRGPYGRFKIVGSKVWSSDAPCAPVPPATQSFGSKKARNNG